MISKLGRGWSGIRTSQSDRVVHYVTSGRVKMNVTNSTNSDVIILLILMLAAWGLPAFDLYQIVSVPALSGEGRYSRGWEMLWAFVLALATWLIMGLLLYRQHTPGGLLIGLLSGAAAFCALQLMDEGTSSWPAVILLLLPPAITGAAFTRQWAGARVALIVISLIPCAVLAGSTIMTSIGKSSQRRGIARPPSSSSFTLVRSQSRHDGGDGNAREDARPLHQEAAETQGCLRDPYAFSRLRIERPASKRKAEKRTRGLARVSS